MPAPDSVDLRSDTLTVPDEGMRYAMAHAEVGDDVWGEDPTVRRLEDDIARRLGKEAGVFVPSGTMGNLACVAAQTHPGDEVIADAEAHLFMYEVGGAALIAGVQLRVLESVDGIPDAESVAAAVRHRTSISPSQPSSASRTRTTVAGAAPSTRRGFMPQRAKRTAWDSGCIAMELGSSTRPRR